LLGIAEGPYLIALNSSGSDTHKGSALEIFTDPPKLDQELQDGSLGNASHATGGPDAVSLHQGRHNLLPFFPA